MEVGIFLPVLALLTLLAVCVIALWSKRATDQRWYDTVRGRVTKSTLAEDAPNSYRPSRDRDDAPR
ncbi:hypothetical protein DLJ49_10585 [Rhodovulum sp. 12E13]|uniref:hypothetical protein n=1 Tax=Rhodovulum sp. 12E13 TaxID=2203891 RepID=UPI000E1AC7D9|nr:hypothetical protein [Rhodovulum sp. 12E13]RDC72351.1 hypothetical protein DLJ49_10585 [Rhodovulum sp. 12E13]